MATSEPMAGIGAVMCVLRLSSSMHKGPQIRKSSADAEICARNIVRANFRDEIQEFCSAQNFPIRRVADACVNQFHGFVFETHDGRRTGLLLLHKGKKLDFGLEAVLVSRNAIWRDLQPGELLLSLKGHCCIEP